MNNLNYYLILNFAFGVDCWRHTFVVYFTFSRGNFPHVIDFSLWCFITVFSNSMKAIMLYILCILSKKPNIWFVFVEYPLNKNNSMLLKTNIVKIYWYQENKYLHFEGRCLPIFCKAINMLPHFKVVLFGLWLF